jgi:hypothetical protein
MFNLFDRSKASFQENVEPIRISSEQGLREELERFKHNDPGSIDLNSPSGDCLTIGISASSGCVMFTQASLDPPYLMARGPSDDYEACIEFLRGGTPTPIPLAYILPIEEVIDIAVYFFLNGSLPETVEWEEQ